MLKTLRRLTISLFIAVFILNMSLLPTTVDATIQVEASTSETTSETTTGIVTAGTLHIRASKSTSAKCIKKVHKGKEVTLLTTGTTWVKVKVGKKIGYTKGKYIATDYGTASKPYANALSGKVTSKVLNIRSKKSSSSTCLTTLSKGDKVKVLTVNTKWVKVKAGDIIGYTQGKYISLGSSKTASNYTTKGESVANYALRFVGNPYVWGGTSLTNGADCSGFVMSVYKHFGISLPHSSYSLRSVGTKVNGLSNAKPGDIICYSGHVAIYLGNNKIVHASNAKDGIKITTNASYRGIVTIRRVFK